MSSCVICRRIKDKDRVVFYEDDLVVASLKTSQVTLGATSVYYKKHVEKFTSLSRKEREKLMDSVLKVSKLLEDSFHPEHMNYMLLGNYHKHLHWHLLPRYLDSEKDAFVVKQGLEYPILGRRLGNKYLKSKKELKMVSEMIKA